MRRLLFVIALSLPILAIAQHQHVRENEAAAPGDPPIKITINPEARVSAMLWGVLPLPVTCGTPADLQIKIINQGFVTAKLEAKLAEDNSEGVTLDFHPEPLRGVPEEFRVLRLTLRKPGPTDVTISFTTRNNAPDLGGRDRIHLLLRCSSNAS